ncbi:MAG: P-type conjugative transfer protein TrbJ [Aestuariivirga sp.]
MKRPVLKPILLAGVCAAMLLVPTPSPAAWVVFDPKNYRQNLLSAVRALEEINNQVKQLGNEAQMLLKMDLNLEQLGSSIGGDIEGSLGEIEGLLKKGGGIAMSVSETEAELKKLFPSEYTEALTGDESLKLAKDRWEEALSAFKRTMALEAKVVEASEEDGNSLTDLLSKSGTAVGNLEVQQAGNELVGLSVKQQLQLLTLIAAEQRASGLDRARTLASQEESRLRFQSFLGDGSAYTK